MDLGLVSDSKLVLDLRGVAGRHLPGFGPPPEAGRGREVVGDCGLD